MVTSPAVNIERGLRRLLVLVTVLLVLAVVGLRVLFSQGPVSCVYPVILANGSLGLIAAPPGATIEQVKIEARRLHPDTKNPPVLSPLTGDIKKDTLPAAPDDPATPESCATDERLLARLARYAFEVAAGTAIALPIAAVLWVGFFALRWVARGFKSAA